MHPTKTADKLPNSRAPFGKGKTGVLLLLADISIYNVNVFDLMHFFLSLLLFLLPSLPLPRKEEKCL